MIQSATVKMRGDIYHKLMNVDTYYFEGRSSNEYISIIENDVDTVRETYFFLLDTAMELITMLAALVVIWYFCVPIGLFLLVTVLIQAMIPVIFKNKLEKAGAVYSDSKAKYINLLREGLSGQFTARVFHVENKLEDRYRKVLLESENGWRKREFTEAFLSSCSYVFNTIAYLGTFLLGAYLIIGGAIRISVLVAIADIVTYVSRPALYLVDDIARIKVATEPFRKIQEILAVETKTHGKEENITEINTFELDRVSFAYEDKQILSDKTFLFEKGKKYLILGRSGCGKTTLLKLMAGVLQNYTGTIRLNGVESDRLKYDAVTRQICYIEQDPFLFNDSIFHNITLYAEDIDEPTVLDALDKVGLTYLVNGFKEGLHTNLKENASRISGGEKQRIALARALVRRPSFILLDESTSHLDKDTAQEIEKLLLALNGVAVIIVSHNPTDLLTTGVDRVIHM
jgi:ABC-type bacteriocin/lantibiotic exporter with double-glycine peptidase domain